LELAFRTRALRETCEDRELAAAEFGDEVAAELVRRLADLRAATSIRDIVAGDPRIDGDRIEIRLGERHALDLVANHVKNPLGTGGQIEWSQVVRLRVMGVSERAET